MVSMSGSSTRKVAQSWQNSPNSISPEPSSSISWSRSFKVQSWKITFTFSFSHLQLLLGGTEAHGPHDLAEVVGGEEILLLGVEEIKAHLMAKMRLKEDLITSPRSCLQALDLIVRKVGRVVDLLKVDISVRIGLGHLQLLLLSCCCCCRCESGGRTKQARCCLLRSTWPGGNQL